MQQLEKPLDNAFKNVPPLPENARKGLVVAMPWLALAGGVLSLVAAYNLYQALTIVNNIYNAFGYIAPVSNVGTIAWVGVALLVVEAVMFFVAFPALRLHKKSGWNLLLWTMVLSVAYSVVVNLFSGGFVDFGQLIFMLLGVAIGLYLLFQVRPYYAGELSQAMKAPATPGETEKPVAKVEKPAAKADKTEPKA